jgi:hypothetical protein
MDCAVIVMVSQRHHQRLVRLTVQPCTSWSKSIEGSSCLLIRGQMSKARHEFLKGPG